MGERLLCGLNLSCRVCAEDWKSYPCQQWQSAPVTEQEVQYRSGAIKTIKKKNAPEIIINLLSESY